MPAGHIELRGVAVNNLKKIDLDIPRQEFVVLCGVSGSGKTSLALDTLYAEGQRRYIEGFSAYTRQFLARLPKPTADRIDGIPPAIAVTHKFGSTSSRATVGTATEVMDYLRLLYARVGQVHCPRCDRHLRRDSADSISTDIRQLPAGTRFMVTYPFAVDEAGQLAEAIASLRADGFVRWIWNKRLWSVDDAIDPASMATTNGSSITLDVIVDRLAVGQTEETRIRESLETALEKGEGRCFVYLPPGAGAQIFGNGKPLAVAVAAGAQDFVRCGFSSRLACEDCQLTYPRLEPRLFSFNSPLGACPNCEGFGNVIDIDMDLVVPSPQKSLADGAVATWNTPAYKHELEKLLGVADACGIPTDVPYSALTDEQCRLIFAGAPEHDFGGIAGFFQWLERRKYKMHIRVFLSRWRSYRTCEACHGTRLRPESLCTRLSGKNLAELCALPIGELSTLIESLKVPTGAPAAKLLLDQVRSRIDYLNALGLEYLSLDRPLRSLSGGEAQRVALTSALGSSLVNMLYVLDEPSVGLHPQDVHCLVDAIRNLCNRGNTVVVVDHEESVIQSADRVFEVGPSAGADGGRITFSGSAEEMCATEGVLTGDYLSGRRGRVVPESRRAPSHGWIRLTGATGNNLQDIAVAFPLGVLCVVTGVSGSGKSTLVEHTLYPALCRRKGKEAGKPQPYEDVVGDGQLDDVMMVDQSPIGRSPRSNPVTYIKAFDAIRNVFADTLQARTHNFKASHFSFNVEGGRCPACKGDGSVHIDMQFLADVHMQCSECQGLRYRREILDIRYRGKSIADVLSMTVRQAYSFFRGQPKVQLRLHQLMEVGLDYLQLGQAANTLSAGEAQRLKLAGYLSAPRRGRTLFLLDEPTCGLHFSDVVQLLDCFDALLSVGHSLIVVEHNVQLMQAADYIIDLGPGAADNGGHVVSQGTPESVSRCQDSATGRILARLLGSDEADE